MMTISSSSFPSPRHEEEEVEEVVFVDFVFDDCVMAVP
jgi:hypothetical protein